MAASQEWQQHQLLAWLHVVVKFAVEKLSDLCLDGLQGWELLVNISWTRKIDAVKVLCAF